MSKQVVQVVAHRGMGQGLIQPEAPPENTLPAFAEGWKIAHACELDVHLTRDGQVIVIHDDTTNRTTNASWTVRDRFAAELRSLDAGRWKAQAWAGTRLPLIEDVLDAMPDGCELFIELKDGPQVVPPTAELVRQSGKSSRVVFISFDIDTIMLARQEMPDNDCLLIVVFEADYGHGRWNVLYDEGPGFRTVTKTLVIDDLIALIKQYGLTGIDTSFAVPPSLITRLLEENLRAVVWTVDEPSIALDMVRLGVNTITTDRPGPIRDALVAAGYKVR
ncbi:MAG TPA: glycerophosphodiester phosphodiesterase family protein [Thermoanaerobaculia bacterium]|jgi:glycerophosphoryl diester phosphodiesterase|nr:glycerophosphodiester phosphodiesterase family protein [Thermoanaerobaculia bacterium]